MNDSQCTNIWVTPHTQTHTNIKTLSWQLFCTVNHSHFFTYEWLRVHEQMSHTTHTISHSTRANESLHTHTHTYIDTHIHSQSQHLSNTSTLLPRHIPMSQDALYKWVTLHTHAHTHTHTHTHTHAHAHAHAQATSRQHVYTLLPPFSDAAPLHRQVWGFVSWPHPVRLWVVM